MGEATAGREDRKKIRSPQSNNTQQENKHGKLKQKSQQQQKHQHPH